MRKRRNTSAFDRRFEFYITFLETQLNGCHKRWFGRTKEHKEILAEGGTLPEWKDVTIRSHAFRVDFCMRSYYAKIPLKTLQQWMGHSDTEMILNIYSKLTKEQEISDALKMAEYMEADTPGYGDAKSPKRVILMANSGSAEPEPFSEPIVSYGESRKALYCLI